jgi:putative membrane protein
MTPRPTLLRGTVLAAAVGIVLVAVMAGWFGLRATLAQIGEGVSALPAAIAVHTAQLALSGLAWGVLLPAWLPVWQLFRARWLREAVNSLLPTASLGGAVAGARLLTRDGRIDAATAGAAAAADITGEAIAQILFLLCGLGLAASVKHAPLSPLWLAAALAPPLCIVGALVGAQALGVAGWIESTAARLLPARLAAHLAGLQTSLAAIYHQRGRVAADIALNFAGWSLGAAEVWLLLRPLHQDVSWRQAYAIESLGVVARSLGFAVPGGLAAQETGFVLACALFGIPHGAGLALSLLKRARELMVGVAGVLYWQWLERGLWRRR